MVMVGSKVSSGAELEAVLVWVERVRIKDGSGSGTHLPRRGWWLLRFGWGRGQGRQPAPEPEPDIGPRMHQTQEHRRELASLPMRSFTIGDCAKVLFSNFVSISR